VHVVVRMNGPFLSERVTEDLVRSVRNHLVRIHVRRRAAPGLEDIEGEVGVQLALHDLLACLDDRLSDLRIEEAELHVCLGRRHLDQAERIEEAPTEADPADREIFDGPRFRHRALGRVSSRWSRFSPIQTVTSKLSLTTVTRYNINALYLEEPEDPPRAREVAHANYDAGGSGGRRRPGLSRMQQRAPRA